MNCVSQKDLLGYAAGTLSSGQQAAIDAHAAGCEQCARERDELLAMTRRMASDPGEFDEPALSDDVLTLVRLGRAKSQPEPKGRRWMMWLAPAVAAAAALLVMLLWVKPGSDPEKFQVRGGPDDPDRWVSVEMFRSTGQGYRPAGESIHSGEALAFTYENRSADYGFLMLLAVDPQGSVHWYYPAHTRENQNPQSIAIRSGSGPVQLPDEIRHRLSPGSLKLFAVFTREPLKVKAVEEMVARDLKAAGSLEKLQRLSLPDSGQQNLRVTVEAGK